MIGKTAVDIILTADLRKTVNAADQMSLFKFIQIFADGDLGYTEQ